MSRYEVYSLIIQIITVIFASIVAFWQVFINIRLKKLNDFVALVIIPGAPGAEIKLLNTGKINLYLHGFYINGNITLLDTGRLISSGSLDSSYYWIPLNNNIPSEGIFDIKIYIKDEFNKKYITLGQGEVQKQLDNTYKLSVWTCKTQQFSGNFSDIK